MKPQELQGHIGDIDSSYVGGSVNDTIEKIRNRDDADRVELLRAVYEGMHDTERAVREEIFPGRPGSRETWHIGRVSPWFEFDEGPLVGASLGAPPARFERVGRPTLDYAAMRFIVASRQNFEFLLNLAEEGLRARAAQEND